MSRLGLLASTATLALLLMASVAQANHKWGKYHWARSSTDSPLALTVNHSNVGGTWQAYNGAVVADWNSFSGGTIDLSSGSASSNMTASSGNYGNNGWLGIARIWIDNKGHITSGAVELNDYYYGPGSPYAGTERQVYCQEVGHIFGLDHNRNGGHGGSPDDTCMNDRNLSFPSPNVHDTEQLSSIYGHDHSSSRGGNRGKKPRRQGRSGGMVVSHGTYADPTMVTNNPLDLTEPWTLASESNAHSNHEGHEHHHH